MTSKALEAAAEKLAEQRTSQPWRLMDTKNREYWRAGASEIIRAFAQNISEEAAEIIWTARGHKSKQECVCAAIEKDLE